MTAEQINIIFRNPISPAQGGYPGFRQRTVKAMEMIIEYDIAVKLRDEKTLFVDIYRPEREAKYPVILAWSPYGKHGRLKNGDLVNSGLDNIPSSQFTVYQGPDAVYWVRNGYIVINADPRGLWHSEGEATFMSPQETEDCCDLIEWAGTRRWSTGKVGMLGVSYPAWIQWKAAAAAPPNLAAICVWEGASDFYREVAFHGGIPETWFYPVFQMNASFSISHVENLLEMQKQHPLFDEYWAGKNADLSKINVPALVVAGWSDHGLDTRGALEGFKKISSREKWLIVHGRKKWQFFYDPESVEKQRQFFNRFLKGLYNRVRDWPRVMLEIRQSYSSGELRAENEWPLIRTQYTKLFLDAAESRMGPCLPVDESLARYSSVETGGKIHNAVFEHRFENRTELTGHMKLKLWVQAEGGDDMDLFVALEKIDRSGNIVHFPYFGNHNDGPAALGWLRVSHRELDPDNSTPAQPVYGHQKRQKLKEGEIVPVEVEIWPSGTLFGPGEKLRLTVQGSDIYSYPEGGYSQKHSSSVNRGEHVIYTGGQYDSHLLVPVIPDQ
ncbi:MAG: CocE/NonD family hydrolase [Dehalococcoidales bacterium]|nr:CocE/NonD family hydrolase [Dehalococcoidales bacterium]